MPADNQVQVETGLITRLAEKTNDWITNDPEGWKAAMVFALARRLPHCKQIAPMMSEALDHDLPFFQRIRIKLHLIVCLACVHYNQHLYFLRQVAHNLTEKIDDNQPSAGPGLSPDARERLKQALKQRQE